MPDLEIYQSLWATEKRIPGVPETPVEARFEAVKAAGYDGMAIDLGAMSLEEARATVPFFAKHGLGGLLTAFPRSIEGLRPALHLAKEIGSPFVVVVGQVMPVTVEGMIPVIRDWLRLAEEEGVPLQFETHRNCITNDMFTALQLLDAIPEMRMAADLSHYVVDREMTLPLEPFYHGQISRILDRCDSFQGRIANRCQVQLPVQFPQTRPWLDLFLGWWREGFARWKARAGADDTLIFLCELGPRDYAITGADGLELSDRDADALILADHARRLFAEV
ncbi:sugar phosphate isomerase/epimerase [Zavarzinia compransoris]|uniref:sugar phosphate isomerase/epimerase family protein n=1 Tax=Zavarzinia marina TaxID=2911065 RepID=UPI001F2B3D05|nr:TIM barrel protein [Zavarzinia marina]MCF4166307.1 sugar phosphate isomerase/epimerase [Zavarzinia marina]